MVLLDFSMAPMGKGESVAPYVARCLEIVQASGLDYRLHAMGTTLERDGLETGMLASWVQQCSFQPPQISVAVHRDREIAKLLTPGSPFTLNILDDTQTDMIVHFGRGFKLSEPAFTDLELVRGES